jgi:putative acetyltransferase
MPEIHPINPSQVAEARRTIYTVAHDIFREHKSLEEDIQLFEKIWPLHDVEDFQRSYVDNGGIFLVMCENGRIICTGALRRLEEQVGEVKRLWLLPEYQGQGLGYQMILRLMVEARERGYLKLRLETSPAYQPRAYAFYRRVGFYEIPRYGDDPDDVGLELVLDPAS